VKSLKANFKKSRGRYFSPLISSLLLCLGYMPAAFAEDAILYSYSQIALKDGKFKRLFPFQKALNLELEKCGLPKIVVDGTFGKGTKKAISDVSQCADIKAGLSPKSEAFSGAITVELWRILKLDPLPTVQERAQTLVLTYEGTDYDHLQWNFCQNKPLWTPKNPSAPCYTNDPTSFITWGPKGATAGGGQEVQRILWRVDRLDKSILNGALGSDADEFRRLYELKPTSTKQLLCTVFVDTARQDKWTAAFVVLGFDKTVRKEFDDHYRTRGSDGGKMLAFFQLYEKLGVKPTEVDYGFFLDRSTHTSVPRDVPSVEKRVREVLAKNSWALSSLNVRRAFSRAFPTASQTQDRLGRDVAYFVDGVGVDSLSNEENLAWIKRNPLKASNVGLSDLRPGLSLELLEDQKDVPTFEKEDPKIIGCPKSVLNSLPPKP
jgi:hypothetical protein